LLEESVFFTNLLSVHMLMANEERIRVVLMLRPRKR